MRGQHNCPIAFSQTTHFDLTDYFRVKGVRNMRNNDANVFWLLPVKADSKDIGLIIVVFKRPFDTGPGRRLNTLRIVKIFRHSGTRQAACNSKLLHRPDPVIAHYTLFPIRPELLTDRPIFFLCVNLFLHRSNTNLSFAPFCP